MEWTYWTSSQSWNPWGCKLTILEHKWPKWQQTHTKRDLKVFLTIRKTCQQQSRMSNCHVNPQTNFTSPMGHDANNLHHLSNKPNLDHLHIHCQALTLKYLLLVIFLITFWFYTKMMHLVGGKIGGTENSEKITFGVFWLGRKIIRILVGPRHFLPKPTKNWSLQNREKTLLKTYCWVQPTNSTKLTPWLITLTYPSSPFFITFNQEPYNSLSRFSSHFPLLYSYATQYVSFFLNTNNLPSYEKKKKKTCPSFYGFFFWFPPSNTI